jgi:Putative porin
MHTRQSLLARYLTAAAGLLVFTAVVAASPQADSSNPQPSDVDSLKQAIAALQSRLDKQEKQIETLTQTVVAQQEVLAGIRRRHDPPAPVLTATTSVEALAAAIPSDVAPEPSGTGELAAAPESLPQRQNAEIDDLTKKVETTIANLGGFKLSGDFRFRADAQLRSANAVAGPLQNIRSRYRVRLNIDKDIEPQFRFHLQLSTGPFNVQTTNDQEFGAMAVKQPFAIAEAFLDYHPNPRISIRGGRMEEVFADNSRFLWDDDVRFDGFQQTAAVPLGSKAFKTLEFRSGEYFLSNPNTPVLAATSPFVAAGYQPGQKVRDANLFHPGLAVSGDFGSSWGQQLTADIQLYRNQNQIQLSSTAAGFPAVINNSLGFTLSGPISASGNATTTPGGAIYSASRYQIARLAYRITDRGIRMGNREMPLYLDLQTSRNVGTHWLRDAMMASVNFGQIRQFGDVRFLYQYAIKDANAIIAQFTDDDLGTGTTTNIAVHALRFDIGLSRSLQWQNLLFIQNERRPNYPAQNFFVPLQRGANPTYRYLGQLSFSF